MNNQGTSKQLSLQKDLSHIFRNAGLTGIGDIFFKLFHYLTVWIIVYFIGPAQYGLYLLALTLVTFGLIFSCAGFPAGLIKFVSQFQGVKDEARVKGVIQFSLKISLLLSLFFVPLLIISAGSLEVYIFKKPGFAVALRWLSLILPFMTLTHLLLASIQGLQVIKYRVYVEKFLQPGCFFLIVFFFLPFGLQLKKVIWAKIISTFFGFCLTAFFLHKAFPLIKKVSPVYENRDLVKFSAPLIPAVFLNFFVLYTDVLMLGYFRSSSEVGIYGVIARMAPLILLPLTSFELIFSPMIADLFHRGEVDRLQGLHRLITKWICILSLPLFSFLVLFAKPFLGLFGAPFTVARLPLIILCFGQLSRVLVGISGHMVLMTGHQNMSLVNNILLFGVNTTLNYFFIPLYGIVGAASATCFSYCLVNGLEVMEIFHVLGIHPYHSHFFKPLIAGISSFLLIFALTNYFPLAIKEVILFTLVFLIFYSIILFFLGFTSEDKFIFSQIKKFFCPVQLDL